jgi:putative CocE/NonD family hydrolase
MRVDRDVPIEMRDGIVLYADVFRPADDGRYPVLLQRTPYNKALNALALLQIDPLRAVARGYVVVIQDVRGRHLSEGMFNPFYQEIDDGYDTVEWCGAQPWSSGDVGMYGGSYVGAVQWLAAIAQPPHLRCIVPVFTSSDYYEGWTYQGGAFQWGFIVSWTLTMLASEGLLRKKKTLETFTEQWSQLAGLIDNMSATFNILPLSDLPMVKDLAPYFSDWLSHANRDAFWKAISIEERYPRVRVPALNVGGWYDIFQNGTLRNFTGLREEGGTREAREGTRLLMGPWNHSIPTTNLVGAHDFGILSSQSLSPLGYDLDGEILRFYDYWLKDIDNGLKEEPAVKLFVMGENKWHYARRWPLADVRSTDYYLHSDGNANSSNGTGFLSRYEPDLQPADVFLYDPRHPVPTRGGQLCCYSPALPYGAFDQSEVEARPDVLVYSTPPLEQDLEVAGPVTLVLWAASSASDTDFTAKLVDVSPSGYARNLTDGVIRARYREGTDQPRPIVPGRVYEYRIDLGSTSNVFHRGHRIVLEVSSSNFPRFDRNPNTGHDLGVDADVRPAMQTVYHDREYPSHLILPIISPPVGADGTE